MEMKDILNTPLDNDDFPGWTIKRYFKELLVTLWEEGEGFSGKRPFGDSGWEYDIFRPLVRHGVVQGNLDEYGCIEYLDKKQAYRKVYEMIDHIFLTGEKDDQTS